MFRFFSEYLTFPLVAREMRSQARSKGTFLLRSLLVLGFLVPIFFVGIEDQFRNVRGSELFGFYANLIFYTLILLGPLLTSGCITAEREEGTLGLLFLSTLRSWDIVLGKFATNFLRLFALTISFVPILAITTALGGVTWQQMIGANVSILALLISSVSVAVFTSAISKDTRKATGLAFTYILFTNIGFWFLDYWLKDVFKVGLPDWVFLISAADAMSEQFSWTKQNYLESAFLTFVIACVQGLFFLILSAVWLPRTLVVSGDRPKWQKISFLQKHRFLLSSPLRFLCHKNPFNWLILREFSLTSLLFILMTIIGVVYFVCYIPNGRSSPHDAEAAFIFSIPIRLVIMALAIGGICRSLARERRERTLELLLSTPLTEQSLISAKLKFAWLNYGIIYLLVGVPALFFCFKSTSFEKVWSALLMKPLDFVPALFMLIIGLYFILRPSKSHPPSEGQIPNKSFLFRYKKWIGSGLILVACVTILIALEDPNFGFEPWIVIELFEDVSFFFMLVALSYWMSLFSKNATSAILKTFGWIVIILLVWVFCFWSNGDGGESFVWFLVGKILLEVIISIIAFARLPIWLREQSGLAAQAT